MKLRRKKARHGTVRLPGDDVVSRAMRILRPIGVVRTAWSKSDIPGKAEFAEVPGKRGTEIKVEISKSRDSAVKRSLSHHEGENTSQKLEAALRALKATLEAGEVATTEGQTSGRQK